MKVIEFTKSNRDKLEEFIKTITDGDTTPAIYIGLDTNKDPVLYMADLSWKELAYIKTALDMHIINDWNQ